MHIFFMAVNYLTGTTSNLMDSRNNSTWSRLSFIKIYPRNECQARFFTDELACVCVYPNECLYGNVHDCPVNYGNRSVASVSHSPQKNLRYNLQLPPMETLIGAPQICWQRSITKSSQTSSIIFLTLNQ